MRNPRAVPWDASTSRRAQKELLCGASVWWFASNVGKNRMDNPADRIVTDPAICHGEPVVRGLRYPVKMILDLLRSGMSEAEILADYADLEQGDIVAVQAYVADPGEKAQGG